jgi:Mrp family chromosome partitioning ATPase
MNTKRCRSNIIATGGGGGVSSARVNVSPAARSVTTSDSSGAKETKKKKKKARVVETSEMKKALVVASKRPLITAVYGTKGGVGKSTSVALLVAAAVRAKRQVLVIDMDAQCSITRMLVPTYPDVSDRQWCGHDETF